MRSDLVSDYRDWCIPILPKEATLKKLFKVIGIAAFTMVLLTLAAAGFVMIRYPRSIPAEDLKVETKPEIVERGRYLANQVAFCMNCHAQRDFSKVAGPVIPKTLGMGGRIDVFGSAPVNAPNITPHTIGDWTDGELKRAITSGIDAKGKPLHPEMPYLTYAHLADEDANAIVAYLRTLSPVADQPPRSRPPFWLGLIARVLPKPYQPKPQPDPGDPVARGRYLVRIADCRACHRSDFSGGMTLYFPDGATVVSQNITPVKDTRIGNWTREDFIGVFASFRDPDTRAATVAPGGMNSVMPWIQYSDMTDADIGAIYDYLRTVPPVKR